MCPHVPDLASCLQSVRGQVCWGDLGEWEVMLPCGVGRWLCPEPSACLWSGTRPTAVGAPRSRAQGEHTHGQPFPVPSDARGLSGQRQAGRAFSSFKVFLPPTFWLNKPVSETTSATPVSAWPPTQQDILRACRHLAAATPPHRQALPLTHRPAVEFRSQAVLLPSGVCQPEGLCASKMWSLPKQPACFLRLPSGRLEARPGCSQSPQGGPCPTHHSA